ncbi:hypothetical protein STEG23_038126, partial [Scotinomys teguina]
PDFTGMQIEHTPHPYALCILRDKEEEEAGQEKEGEEVVAHQRGEKEDVEMAGVKGRIGGDGLVIRVLRLQAYGFEFNSIIHVTESHVRAPLPLLHPPLDLPPPSPPHTGNKDAGYQEVLPDYLNLQCTVYELPECKTSPCMGFDCTCSAT